MLFLRDQSGETLRNAYRNNWLRSYGRPRILVFDQQRSLCSIIFAENVESEETPLETWWRNSKTERAGKDWKEDYYKMTQDGPEAQTWTDFEEACDAVNQARASKINDNGCSPYQRVFGKKRPQMEDVVLAGRSEPAADRRIGTGTIDGNDLCTTQRNTTRANCTLDNLSGFGAVERTQQKDQPAPFGTRV